MLDEAGPGEISHVWITIASDERFHLKKMVLRMYWDGETSPSVEAPVGDFFGLGLGEYFLYQSAPLSVGGDKALNCFFPMPFQKHARITLTNEGRQRAEAIYWNIDMRAYKGPLPADTFYFHAQYRQATPNKAFPENKINLDGKENYVWMEATGRGHFAGVTMSVLENQDGWWGEGDDMFFVDGEKLPSINGTGSEDYFLGAWDFGGQAICLRAIRSARRWRGTPGRKMVRLSIPSGLSDSVYEISARYDRTWACQRSRRQLLFSSVLVSERTSRNFPGAASRGDAAATRLSGSQCQK